MLTSSSRLIAGMLAILTALSLMMVGTTQADAAELRWRSRPFQIVASDKPLPDFLRELAASQGTTAVIAPEVSGVISGKFSGPAQTILTSVCATYGLTWYYDGAFLYVDPASAARSEVIRISSTSAARIAETIMRLRIEDSRYPLSISEAEGTVVVSGPKRYVDLVRQAVKLVDQRAALVDHAEIRMFPLKYAWAGDFKINRVGKEATVPGVAAVLRSLYAKSAKGVGRVSGSLIPTMRMGPVRELPLQSGEKIAGTSIEPADATSEADSGVAPPSFASSDDLPQFHADSRMNAVIVRDLPERMNQYANVIASMDVRPRLIEIEVTIMDISSDTLNSLGVDWRLHTGNVDAQFGRGDRPPLTFDTTTEAGGTGTATPIGGLFTAAIGNDLRNYLLARVNALSEKGQAEFVARPKVLTLDNTEAVLENLSEFHVRVDGFQDAGLFNIVAGTSVRVTPLIVDETTGRGVMMSINIEDGNLGSITVDNIPIIHRRNVNTQALVDEGSSLLIAGFTSEEKTDSTTGVPYLSDVPIIGNLFKYTEKTRTNLERFYLLTPRLVIPAMAAKPSTGG